MVTKHLFLAAGTTLCILLGATGVAHAADPIPITGSLGSPPTNCGSYAPTDPSPHTFMVGDSITAGGKADLQRLRPHWEIQGLRGRNVDCLGPIVAERLQHGWLSRIVIALGTNAVQGWGQDDYQAVVDMLPAHVVVVFVNTYRDPAHWPATNPLRTRARVQYFYSRDMAAVAAGRAKTSVINWRGYAFHHPEMLRDGTHPNWKGKRVWASMISEGGAS